MAIKSPDSVPPAPRIHLHDIQIAAAYPHEIAVAPDHCGPHYKEIEMNQIHNDQLTAISAAAAAAAASNAPINQDHTIMPDINVNVNPTFPAGSIQEMLAANGVDVKPLEQEPAVKRSAWKTAGKYTAITLGVAAVAGGAYLAYRHFADGGEIDDVIETVGETADAFVS